jgi:hypothetical protein
MLNHCHPVVFLIEWGKFRWGDQILKNLGNKLKPLLKKNGLFVLGEMSDLANRDVKRRAEPVANCDHLEDHHGVPIWNLKNIIIRLDKYI